MIGLVVTGHGHFADGLHTSAQMIAGESEYVRYVNFEEGMSIEQLADKLNAAYAELDACDGIVVLSDLPGGSPFRTAVESSMTLPEKQTYLTSSFSPAIILAEECMPSANRPWPVTTKPIIL